ncbi:outer membrane protein [Halospina denitrificans]|uniref:Outer membrane protein n=1 Tax=Halospina denitrificans TaxID=332522 RepID=A0A4R7JYD0_9GAMM|nr:TIGR04219 family outer membrane beta-barrel protein [Halospina denitrificans]TDT42954.1 outer membrane protein [Halospina denitrificans]
MKRTMTAAAGMLLLAGASTAHAVIPLIDVDVTANSWQAGPTGTVQSGGNEIDVEDDLGYDDESHTGFAVRFAHPVPVIPNLRLRYNDIEHKGQGTVTTQFRDSTYAEDVDSRIDLTHYDYTIFYTAPVPIVTLDLGFNVKHFDGQFDIEGQTTGQAESVKIDEFLPMLHARGDVDLPLTGLGAGAEINYVSYDGDSARDIEAYLKYSVDPVYVEGGYRELSMDVDSNNLNVDTDLGGPFVRVGIGF